MKNIIYLSLITAVVLCSCKGNSYMKQRYTHYSHGSKKASQEAVAVKASPKTTMNEMTAAEIVPQENSQQPLASVDNRVTERSVAKQASSKTNSFQLPKIKDISRMVTLPSQKLTKNSTDKQNAAKAHKGLIFGLIDLALFIIIVAVIIAAILLLVFVII